MTMDIGVAGSDVGIAFDAAANAQSLVGKRFAADDYYEIGREKVREYTRSVQDYHPVHWDEDAAREFGYRGLLAPLTFLAMVGIATQRRLFEHEIKGYDVSQVLHTEQVYTYHRPIGVGDRLSCEVYLESFRQAFGGDLLATKAIITDQHGETVITADTGLIARSGVADEAVTDAVGKVLMHGIGGSDAPITRPDTEAADTGPWEPATQPRGRNARAFESVAVGDALPARTMTVTLGDLVNYAGASGDPNPIHWSPEVAASVGLPSVVAHGMLTMALGAGFVTSWLGDPGAVLEYGVRFTSPVFVTSRTPGEIEYSGKVKSVDPEARTAVVAIVATHNGKKIFGRATATVALR